MPRGKKPPTGPAARRIAAVLRERAKDLGKSQIELESVTGISQSQISLILRGERAVDVDQLQALCDALDLSMHEVMSQS
jgi:transcriptional regulator with XRE-family HTH domain